MRTLSVFATGILLALGVVTSSSGQDYPAREIRSICNFAPGSGADIIVRYYSDQLSRLAGKPVVVENKPGAQGSIASAFVAKSAPDGYTIHITPASSTLASAPHIFKQLPFDPLKDFATVTTINSLTFVVAVDASKPFRSISDLVSHLKAKPGHGFYGTQSNSGQIAAELFKSKTGLETVYVPFKVTGDAFTNLLSGQIDFMSVDSTWARGQAKVRILAVTAAKRAGTMPEIPTLAEAGVPGIDVAPWWGVVVPAGTPRPIIDKLAGWFNQITAAEETRQFLARAALDPFPGSPEQMSALLKTEMERWGNYVKLAKIEPQ
ncbi:MAG TPA: tripartite tricarboxylate transporter substrate binding protein [Burkholderiales bacterium]|nr:tripartite tricarboxylate transporter substrate binding protein [Burkholderiales bacterium]